MPRSGVGHDNVLIVTIVVDNTLYTGPRVLNVVEVPPHVTVLDDGAEIGLHPRVDLVNGPAAGVDHGPAGSVQEVTELGVPPVHFGRMGVTAVQLNVVDVPRGEGVGVDLQRAQHTWVTCARVVSEVLVDAELQTFGVNLKRMD